MVEWTDSAIVLSVTAHGEANAVLEVFAEEQGRTRGYVRGGAGRRQRGVLQPGNGLSVTWRARVESQLGTMSAEPVVARAGAVLTDPLRLAGLNSLCAVLSASLPEREGFPRLYAAAAAVLDLMTEPAETALGWASGLVRLEVGLLTELGYGLDLSQCAATGSLDDLIYVSPKTGRAVSADPGRPYHDRLLALPPFLLASQSEPQTMGEVIAGFDLTGHFLDRHLIGPVHRKMPRARMRLVDILRKQA